MAKSDPHTEYWWYGSNFPDCNLCPAEGRLLYTCEHGHEEQGVGIASHPCGKCGAMHVRTDPVPAWCDAKMLNGKWAYLCEYHADLQMVKLGLGRGQHLIDARGQDSGSSRLGGTA